MKLCIASDHAGTDERLVLVEWLKAKEIEVADFGPDKGESVDYPEYAAKVANAVGAGDFDLGILICGSGIGMSMAANKVKGVRAALVHNAFTTEMSRKHNNANVLCLGARILSQQEINEFTELWLQTEFEGGRHERRVAKIMDLDAK